MLEHESFNLADFHITTSVTRSVAAGAGDLAIPAIEMTETKRVLDGSVIRRCCWSWGE